MFNLCVCERERDVRKERGGEGERVCEKEIKRERERESGRESTKESVRV